MAINNFNFDDTDLFGSDTNSDNNDFGFDTSDFNLDSSANMQGNNSSFSSNMEQSVLPDGAFDGAFDDNQQTFQDDSQPNDSKAVTKKAIIAVAVGVAGIMFVLIIAGVIGKKSQEAKNQNTNSQVNSQQSQYYGGGDASSIMNNQSNTSSTQNKEATQSNVTTSQVVLNPVSDVNNIKWIEIDSQQQVNFKDEYSELTFTVTDIKHYARAVDESGTLDIKTTLTGSISGMPGTYTLDVPYSQGVILDNSPELGIGCTFTVYVQIGDYNGKKVIGEISTYRK